MYHWPRLRFPEKYSGGSFNRYGESYLLAFLTLVEDEAKAEAVLRTAKIQQHPALSQP